MKKNLILLLVVGLTALTLAGCSGDSGIDNATEVNQGGTDIIGNATTESEPTESEVVESTEPTAEPTESEVAEPTESEVADSTETGVAESEPTESETADAVDILGQTTLEVLEPNTEYVIPSKGFTDADPNTAIDISVKVSYTVEEVDNGDGTKTITYTANSKNDGTVEGVSYGAHLCLELFDKYTGMYVDPYFDPMISSDRMINATTADGETITGIISFYETQGSDNVCSTSITVPTDYDGVVFCLRHVAEYVDANNKTASELEESGYIVAWLSN